ncbi:MAG: hypothetical protein HZB38_18690 [Planctomycetes bacterium]|nr:hypothetical protein [Planctomycetota bacterium]
MGKLARSAMLAAWLALAAAAAHADQYWVAYEGNDFPENQGWERHYYAPQPSIRTIVDGSLRLDSRDNFQTYDFYEIDRQINPGSGELFISEWRVRTLENDGILGDPGIVIAPDQEGTLALQFFPDHVVSRREGWSYPISSGSFHNYRLESSDMVAYALWIDGALAISGQWDLNSVNRSLFNFGDGIQGVRSLSEWDYVRFGVIPEPESAVLVGCVAGCLLARSANVRWAQPTTRAGAQAGATGGPCPSYESADLTIGDLAA